MASILSLLVPLALAKTEESPPTPTVIGELVDQPSPTPEKYVEIFSAEFGVSAQLAKEIIRCESGWVRTAKNPRSSAGGYFQFLDSTWRTTMVRMGLPTSTPKDDPIISLKAGVWLLSQDGSGHWLESKQCWN